ncbi:LuxR family transcriptional regulator [Micromonospora avicenniae]|uniref:AAA ATPase domain-containing protein n=1 Tax=Micromonospora avicenniae TaxID=1198245 RepID=A0A1N7FUU9_9ACTN|nr:LuxR family transcriptional regulator [Micromonospora avicenniae]SIS04036.1 AAA ATPase domain-containing protein [Micromonospora avicenniae]
MVVHASVENRTPHPEPPLRGTDERARLDALVRTAAAGDGGALRIVGERGSGKSCALDYVIGRATGFRVLRVRAVPAERDIAYASLHLLCDDLLDESGFLSARHRMSLDTAFGRMGDSRPEPAEVGPAALELLGDIARAGPVCIAVDDAHWLDTATAEVLAYVAAHAAGRAVLLLVTTNGTDSDNYLDNVPVMRLRPLTFNEVRTELASLSPGPLDESVVQRMLLEAHGNLRVLAESLQGFTAAELAGGFAVPAPLRTRSCSHGRCCIGRAAQLTPPARQLLLAAAADPSGDVVLHEHLAAELGASSEVLTAARLLEIGECVAFSCSELRSVSYHAATPDDRRLIHRKLGEAITDDRVRKIWHLGLAAVGHDDNLADELEESAGLAQSRGGAAARAAFLEKAAHLTSDRGRRADRALTASAAKYDSGDLAAAQQLLALVDTEPAETRRAARHDWQRSRIATVARPGAGSIRQLLAAARRLRALDPTDAREAYLETLTAAMAAGDARGGLLTVVAEEARLAAAAHRGHPVDQLLFGLATRVLDGYGAAVQPLSVAVRAFLKHAPDLRTTRWFRLAALIAADLWDAPAWMELTGRSPVAGTGTAPATPIGGDASGPTMMRPARQTGTALDRLAADQALSWRVTPASVGRCAVTTPARQWLRPLLAPISETAHNQDAAIPEAVAAAVLHNAGGRYDEALDAARNALRYDLPGFAGWALAELVEAAVRTGDLTLAAEAAARLHERTASAGTDWALGMQAMADALLAEERTAETHYEQAIERLARSDIRCQLGRVRLLYGEWLRRRNRRVDARDHLRAAGQLFSEIGATGFAERTRRELLATGESTGKRTEDNRRQLTPQESRVAALAREGLSNAEIAGQLFLSPRTVEYHLYKAFAKLGINSRAKLQMAVAGWRPDRATSRKPSSTARATN